MHRVRKTTKGDTIRGDPLITKNRQLVRRLLEGDRLSLARAITLVENGGPEATELLDQLYSHTGRAFRIGITGPPGAGKSTLVGCLATLYWESGKKVGVVAVDPSSPFTHGALLGDRIRFRDLPDDPGIFVRSMASRGSPGGLAYKTGEACDVLDAYGKDVILVETVGVGQSELEVAAAVHTTIVVLVPESGDEVQAMKAGLMEIGDVFAVNKSDREGANRITRNLQDMLKLRPHGEDDFWAPPVEPISALKKERLDELVEQVRRHREWLDERGLFRRLKRERAAKRIKELIEEDLSGRFWSRDPVRKTFQEALKRIEAGDSSPYREAALLLSSIDEAREW